MSSRPIDILLVDDSHADRTLVRLAFQRISRDVQLHLCESGSAALDFLNRRGKYASAPRPQACLVDINMPGVNGFDFLETVKKDSRLRTIPVYMFSSSDDDADVQKSYERHASGYIQKPMERGELESLLKTLTKYWTKVIKFPSAPTP